MRGPPDSEENRNLLPLTEHDTPRRPGTSRSSISSLVGFLSHRIAGSGGSRDARSDTGATEGSAPTSKADRKGKLPDSSYRTRTSLSTGQREISIIPVHIIVRFSDGDIPDLNLHCDDASQIDVSWLRKKIRSSLPKQTERRRLRLINAGRIINDSTDFIRDILKVKKFRGNDEVSELIHVDDTPRSSSGDHPSSNESAGPESATPTVYIHCMIGDLLTDEEVKQENMLDNKQPRKSTLPEPIGFDRLRQAGFSDEEIQDLRAQFSTLYGGVANVPGNDIRQLEERWIESGVGENDEFANTVGASEYGGNEDLLLGILMGFFLGVLSVFFIRESSLYSRRQIMAILAGIVINFAFALLRIYY